MSLRPPPIGAEPDPRLGPYRERAGELVDADDNEQAMLFLRVETWWTQEGGHLWWRRWSAPREAVHCYIALANGWVEDFIWELDTLADELEDWKRGRFRLHGEVFHVKWLDDTASRRVRIGAFGLDENPDADLSH